MVTVARGQVEALNINDNSFELRIETNEIYQDNRFLIDMFSAEFNDIEIVCVSQCKR